MIRALLAAILLMNAATPAMPTANAAPADAGPSQHAGHDMANMSDMSMDDVPAGQPASDCCDDGSLDCQCGCFVQQPGAMQFVPATRSNCGAPEPAVVVVSRYISYPFNTPFRPPA
jgi:hypothetical protein